MIVTIQRYFLILKSPDEDNLPTVRSVSFLGFWIIFTMAIVVAATSFHLLTNIFHITSFTYKANSFNSVVLFYIIYVLVTSLPDICSFGFYISLLKVMSK